MTEPVKKAFDSTSKLTPQEQDALATMHNPRSRIGSQA